MKLFSRRAAASDSGTDMPRRRIASEKQHAEQRESAVFRRNRTLSGSTSQQLSSVNTLARAQSHDLRRRRRHFFGLFVVTLILLGMVGTLVAQFSVSAVVTHADTQATQAITKDEYQDTISEYFRLYPLERFRFTTNVDQLTAYLQQTYPEISKVTPKGASSLGVSRYALTFRVPVASWTVNQVKYYTDAAGVDFTRNYFTEPTVRIVDNSGVTSEDGSALVSTRLLSFVGQVVAGSKEKGYTVTVAELPKNTTRQVYLTVKGKGEVRMTIDTDGEAQVRAMDKTLRYLAKNKTSFSYIDVRADGKAFYR